MVLDIVLIADFANRAVLLINLLLFRTKKLLVFVNYTPNSLRIIIVALTSGIDRGCIDAVLAMR
jgi:hypothetical protein